MQNFSISPKEMAANLWRNRSLVKELVKREVVGRYRGSFMGILGSFFNPVFMLAVYTFVFSIVFNLFAECANRAPSLILSNAKQR